jgi:hypothetical protein
MNLRSCLYGSFVAKRIKKVNKIYIKERVLYMDKDNIKAVLNKRFGLRLISMGFPLVNVEPSIKNPGEVTFFFQKSDELEKAFSVLLNESKVLKGMNGINLGDLEIILKVLQNYQITDEERFPVMEKVQLILDQICDIKPYTRTEGNETISDIELKKSMSNCK